MENFYKYLPITQTEKDWGFYITTVGCTRTHPKEAYPPSKDHPSTHSFTWNKGRILNGFYLVFIAQGQGTFESSVTTAQTIKAGTCFFLFPNVWHRYKPDLTTGWEEYWVGFNGNYPKAIMNKNFFSPKHPFINVGLNESILTLFQRLLENVRDASPGYHQIISGITLEILGVIHKISAYKRQHKDPDIQLIHKAMFLLRESLEEQINIQNLAHSLPMGYSKFRKLFKTVTGLSPHQYHIDLRIDKAKELLHSTQLNINEIAYQVGFDSEFYFSNLFKKKTGTSPNHYRVNNKA